MWINEENDEDDGNSGGGGGRPEVRDHLLVLGTLPRCLTPYLAWVVPWVLLNQMEGVGGCGEKRVWGEVGEVGEEKQETREEKRELGMWSWWYWRCSVSD